MGSRVVISALAAAAVGCTIGGEPPDGGGSLDSGVHVPPEAWIIHQMEGGLGGLWGSSADDLWTANDADYSETGRFVHLTGDGVEHVEGLFNYPRVHWGSSANDVWASTGEYSLQVVHYDGASWTVVHMLSPMGYESVDFADVWGSGPDDVWFVGARGLHDDWLPSPVILHLDHGTWSEVPAPPSVDPYFIVSSVWTRARGDVWLVSDHTLYRDTGAGWEPVAGAPRVDFVRGTSSGEVFVAAVYEDHHTLERWVDGAFEPVGDPSQASFRLIDSLWVDSADSVWVAAHQLEYEGEALSVACEASSCVVPTLRGRSTLWGQVAHWNGEAWIRRSLDAYAPTGLWSQGDGRLFFVTHAVDPDPDRSRTLGSLVVWSPSD
jgi:hypothetical protein